MKAKTMRRDALAETYADVQLLIHKTCHDFQKQYGGDYQDLFSYAQEIFIAAYDRYTEGKGMKFTTWVRQLIWWKLKDEVRVRQQHLVLLPREDVGVLEAATAPIQVEFDLEDFCAVRELSKGARLIVKLVATRRDVPDSCRDGKAALKEILATEYKWTPEETKACFAEIITILKEVA